jgi:hypothetical protein
MDCKKCEPVEPLKARRFRHPTVLGMSRAVHLLLSHGPIATRKLSRIVRPSVGCRMCLCAHEWEHPRPNPCARKTTVIEPLSLNLNAPRANRITPGDLRARHLTQRRRAIIFRLGGVVYFRSPQMTDGTFPQGPTPFKVIPPIGVRQNRGSLPISASSSNARGACDREVLATKHNQALQATISAA